jgi:hypothetical protein
VNQPKTSRPKASARLQASPLHHYGTGTGSLQATATPTAQGLVRSCSHTRTPDGSRRSTPTSSPPAWRATASWPPASSRATPRWAALAWRPHATCSTARPTGTPPLERHAPGLCAGRTVARARGRRALRAHAREQPGPRGREPLHVHVRRPGVRRRGGRRRGARRPGRARTRCRSRGRPRRLRGQRVCRVLRQVAAARKVFDGVAAKDVVSWNSMVAGTPRTGTRTRRSRCSVPCCGAARPAGQTSSP